jgi:hypothetical protein
MSWGNDCYGDRFEFDLHEMRNASEETRRHRFEFWLTGQSFACQSCEEEFTPNMATVEEGDEVLCPACAAAKSGAGTGWGRR